LRDVLFAQPDELGSRATSKANREKSLAGATPPTFSCNCWLAGPVPLRFSALSARANEEPAAMHWRLASI